MEICGSKDLTLPYIQELHSKRMEVPSKSAKVPISVSGVPFCRLMLRLYISLLTTPALLKSQRPVQNVTEIHQGVTLTSAK